MTSRDASGEHRATGPADAAFGLASARRATRKGRIAEWVGEFLASRGSNNAVLAAALAQRPHQWAGPVRVRLEELERLAGPADEDVLCPIEPDEWEGDVGAMEDSIDTGWDPPPLLAEYRDGRLFLQDGNHRYEALARAGEQHAWVLVYCDEPEARDRFRAAVEAAEG
jgi:hypothetical protein